MSKTKILIVDDEHDILEFLKYNFEKEGYSVFTASNGVEGIEEAKRNNPDLIVLDVMMPEMDGIEVCKLLRKHSQFEYTRILFLTARSDDFSEIAGFDSGADDYVTKPIRPKALLVRVKSLLKRGKEKVSSNTILRFGELFIDIESRIVKVNSEIVELPKKEFNLLLLLVSKPEKVFSREEIYKKIWGDDIIVGDRTMDVHIRKLRKNIGKQFIKTTKGVGYAFKYK